MKKKPNKSIDGMLLRPSTRRPVDGRPSDNQLGVPKRFLDDTKPPERGELPKVEALSRREIDASLNSINESEETKSKKRRLSPFRRKRGRKWARLSKKKVIIIILLLFALVAGYFGAKLWLTSARVFDGGGIFGLLSSGERLKEGPYGRSNILLFGTSEDEKGHPGALLTDTMIIISIDQDDKNVVMFSVPRDLWVDYGKTCMAGYEGKINAVYRCYSNAGQDPEAGANGLRRIVGEKFGINVPYSSAVSYQVVKDLVNAVGGIDVNIDSEDPRGILDRNFDWKCNYQCYLVKYDNGPAHLNGKQALHLARARNASGGYGLSGGNFDREQNQQMILRAFRDKLLSVGTLANPLKLNQLLDAVGDNVRTNIDTGEVKTLIDLIQNIKDQDIRNFSFVDPENQVVTTGSYGGQSIVRPAAGLYDFSQVKNYIRAQLVAGGILAENASIVILNGGAGAGAAGKRADSLAEAGFVNVSSGNTEAKTSYDALQWYNLSQNMPKTTAKLAEKLGEPASGTSLPNGVKTQADFVIIISNGSN